jgi:anti-sigma-K factor RskA
MNYDRPDLLDRLASEYVLGTLRGRARRRFEHLIRTRPLARSAVREWEERLAPLAVPVPPVAPPLRVWSSIEARTAPAGASARRAGWSQLWKPLLGFALGAIFTVGLVQWMPGQFMSLEGIAQREQALPQSYVGLLLDQEGLPTLLVSSTRHGTRATVKSLRPVIVPPGKVAQVWALPREGAPFPIGVIVPAKPPGSTQFELPQTSEKLLSNVGRLAVSFEDSPSAPGSKPSGFIASGFCVKLW